MQESVADPFGVQGLLCHRGLANLDCLHRHPGATAENHVWVPGMAWVCVEIPRLGCCQGPRGCPGSQLRHVTMLVSEGCATAGIRPIWAARAVDWRHHITQTGARGKGHVWVWGLAVARVCVMSVTPPKAIEDHPMAGVWAATCGSVGI